MSTRSGAVSGTRLFKILKIIQKDLRQFTEEQEIYLKKVMRRIEEGALPKQTMKTALKAIQQKLKNSSGQPVPLHLLAVLQKKIPDSLLESHISESSVEVESPREVILSEYFMVQ